MRGSVSHTRASEPSFDVGPEEPGARGATSLRQRSIEELFGSPMMGGASGVIDGAETIAGEPIAAPWCIIGEACGAALS